MTRRTGDRSDLFPANQEVLHEPGRASSITLPVWTRA